jgi:hypothetical protein
MVHTTAPAEIRDRPDQRPIRVRRGSDDELHRHSGDAAGMQRVRRAAMRPRFPLPEHQPAHPLEAVVGGDQSFSGAIGARVAPHGVSKFTDTRVARLVSRSIWASSRRDQLHMDVAREAIPLAQQLEGSNH